MKKLFFLSLLAFAFTATTNAQRTNIAGKWAGQFPNPDGTALKFTLTLTDNTYEFDMGMDGTTDLTGSYTSEGDQITIWNTSGESDCPSDQKGVYKVTQDGNTTTFTKVTDACPGRGAEPLVVKRM